MKKKLTNKLLIFTSAGALLSAGALVADDAEIKATGPAGNAKAKAELRTGAGAKHADRGQFKQASDLIGSAVHNQQNEKIGEIKDLMVDLSSGRVPLAVVSSGGFFGVGDRMMAIPTSSFSQSSDKVLSVNLEKDRLQDAPNFDRNSWPDLNDREYTSKVYRHYGQEQTTSYQTATSTRIDEPAGADLSGYVSSEIPGRSDSVSQSYGETPTGLSRDRTPRQGLGSEDLTKNQQKIYNPDGYAQSDAFIRSEAAGAERNRSNRGTAVHSEQREGWTKTDAASSDVQMGKTRRASELMGMEVKNAQGERIGEIKDVVIDLKSGRVAYTVLNAGSYAGTEDRLYAIPSTVFSRSSDERTLVLNADKEMLKAGPSFEKNSWADSNNQQFNQDVYRYYKQPIYWQSSGQGGQINEPSGSELDRRQDGKRNSSGEWERGNNPPHEFRPESKDQSDLKSPSDQSGVINEPSGAEPETSEALPVLPSSEQNQSASPEVDQSQGTAARENQEALAVDPAKSTEVVDPAGAAATSTTPATSDDQAVGQGDRQLSDQLRTKLKNDTDLSSKTQNVQVSAANGRITLRGSVASEQEKQAVEAKAREIVGSPEKVDNQLRVTTETTNP